MHILQIIGAYGSTEVYTKLAIEFDKLGFQQTIYAPLTVSNHDVVGKFSIDFKNVNSKIIYSTTLKKYHKFLYGMRIQRVVKDIESRIQMNRVDFIICANICTDGAVAYELNKKYGIQYITAIRNTDLYTYYALLFWRRIYFNKVFNAAKNVSFISPSLKTYFHCHFGNQTNKEGLIIPNAIKFDDNFNQSEKSLDKNGTIRLLFASSFYKGKNLKEIILAIDILRDKGYKIELDAYGKNLPFRTYDIEYIKDIETLSKVRPWIRLFDYVPKKELYSLYAKYDIFIMPSKPETFGLVYIEALTHGLPIVYAKNQGIYGFFKEGEMGYAAEAFNVKSIAEAVLKVISEYGVIVNNIKEYDFKKDFSWEVVAKKYLNMLGVNKFN